jgi:hypothetical protein
MAERAGLTVGSLLGVPLGRAPSGLPQDRPGAPSAPAVGPPVPSSEGEGRNWVVTGGEVTRGSGVPEYRADNVERLTYDNPYGQTMERVWYDGKIVFAVDLGEVDVDAERVKVAQEYQIVYAVELDDRGKWTKEPELVPGQLNIYDSVPGMDKYSPIWQFNYVVVPRDYAPNTLRSEADCLGSGYPVLRSNVFEN